MKKSLLMLIGLLSLSFAQGQVLFFEDFQDVTDIEMVIDLEELDGADEVWANIDQDGVPDNNNDVSEWGWAIGPEHTFIDGTTVALIPLDGVEDVSPNGIDYTFLNTDGLEDTNFVFSSSSWLTGFADGNRNLLVLPAVEIPANGAELSWKSSTAQGPRYSDGYSVYVAIGDYFDQDSYVEVFRVAQCVPPVPSPETTGAAALDLPNAEIFHEPLDAYINYDGFDTTAYLGTYFHLGEQDYEQSSSFRGLLEPFSLDLGEYAGETVRVMFLHDSDDDVSMSIDDILIEAPLGLQEDYADFFDIYPNPAESDLNIQFTEELTGVGVYRIIDSKGTLVYSNAYRSNGNGDLRTIDVANLAAGSYTFQLLRDGERALSTSFLKK